MNKGEIAVNVRGAEEERGESSAANPNMRTLWKSIEAYLCNRFSDATRIVTPFSDPLFETEEYQAFLRSLNYHKVLKQPAYGKDL